MFYELWLVLARMTLWVCGGVEEVGFRLQGKCVASSFDEENPSYTTNICLLAGGGEVNVLWTMDLAVA